MKQLVYFSLISLLLGHISSCKRLGCMEENSLNYQETAQKDDGSCVYEGELIIWFSLAKSNAYITAGISELHFISNNELIGTIPVSDFSTTVPKCDAPSGFVRTMKLGKVASKTFTVIVRDDLDNFLVQKTFEVEGDDCTVIQLN